MPICWKSPNHIDPTDTLLAFLMVVLVGAKRFAHAGLLRGDRALHALLGLKRFPTDDYSRHGSRICRTLRLPQKASRIATDMN